MQIPVRITGAWISILTDDELHEVERQLVADMKNAEELASQYVVHDPANHVTSFLDFGMHCKLSRRCETLRRRHDRICEELVNRGFRDPSNLMKDGLKAASPAMPTKSWLTRLSDEELVQKYQQALNEVEELNRTLAKLSRMRPTPPERAAEATLARTEILRQEVFCYFISLEAAKRPSISEFPRATDQGFEIWIDITPTDYAAGRAEEILFEWLHRWSEPRPYQPLRGNLLRDLEAILQDEAQQVRLEKGSDVRTIFRQIAKMAHPDLAISDADRIRRNNIMSEANKAYENLDESKLSVLLLQLEETH